MSQIIMWDAFEPNKPTRHQVEDYWLARAIARTLSDQGFAAILQDNIVCSGPGSLLHCAKNSELRQGYELQAAHAPPRFVLQSEVEDGIRRLLNG